MYIYVYIYIYIYICIYIGLPYIGLTRACCVHGHSRRDSEHHGGES